MSWFSKRLEEFVAEIVRAVEGSKPKPSPVPPTPKPTPVPVPQPSPGDGSTLRQLLVLVAAQQRQLDDVTSVLLMTDSTADGAELIRRLDDLTILSLEG